MKDSKKRSNPWEKSRAGRIDYERKLRKVAREIGRIIEGHNIKTPEDARRAQESLQKYADLLAPWARNAAEEMLQHANMQDIRAWNAASKEIGINLRAELSNSATGEAFQNLMDDQVKLIKSMPIEAGERVHHLATEVMINGQRYTQIIEEIQRSGEVAESKATLIARTETSRASTTLTQARAESVGSEAYIWRTAHDGAVRPSHRKMEGKTVKWNAPPTLDKMTGHAGCLPNCRCWAEVILPRRIY